MRKMIIILFVIFLNSTMFSKITIFFSHETGFYDKPFFLKIYSNEKNAEIYYTLDGSEPIKGTLNTFLYTEPIEIVNRTEEENKYSSIKTSFFWIPPKNKVFKGTVVKVKIYIGNKFSKTITKSYFIAPKDIYNFLVISIVTDPVNLFDYKRGIYVLGERYNKNNEKEFEGNFNNKGKKWEREVHVDFIENGKLVYEDDMGVRIHGGFTSSLPLKSLRLYARDKYGKKKIKYEIFPELENYKGEIIDEYDKLILRNGGNDFEKSFFRDVLVHYLVKDMKFDIQAFRPAIHFINGEYWGIVNIRERYDADYIKEHYDISKKDVILLKVSDDFISQDHIEVEEGKKEDIKSFLELKRFIIDYNMAIKKNYSYVKNKIDIQNYIEYIVTEIFINNRDWPANNIRFWRKRENFTTEYGHDGKWRFMLFDTDNSLQSHTYNTLKYAIEGNYNGTYLNPTWSTAMFQNLLVNEEFKNNFINTFMDHLNTTFSSENTKAILRKFKTLYEKEMREHIKRWNYPKSYEYWLKSIENMEIFFDERPKYIKKYIKEYFRLSEVQFTLEDFKNGKILINSITIDKGGKYVYFKGIPIRLKAFSNENYTFKYWIINEKIYEKNEISIDPEIIKSIKPIFERVR